MKISILFFLLVFIYSNTSSQWVQKSNGMGADKTVWSLAVSGDNIFAGTDVGVYLSTDNGENWYLTSFNSYSGHTLLIKENNIFIGTSNGIYRSTDNGLNWTQYGANIVGVWSLASSGNNIYAGTDAHGVYRSTDNGLNWTQTSLKNCVVSSLLIYNGNIIAGDWTSPKVHISTDNGDSWTQVSTGGNTYDVVLSLTVLGNYIFLGSDNVGIFCSTNGGYYWSRTSLVNGSVTALTVEGNFIFAGDFLNNDIYLSTNFGGNWISKNQGLGNLHYLWSLTTNNQYVFLGTDSSVWRRSFSEIIEVNNISSNVPDKFSLYQNYPNPFNPKTIIKFQIKDSRFVTLKVYDILGKEIATLVNEKMNAGTYEVPFSINQFSNNQIPSGVYFYKLVAGDYTETKKMVLIK